MKPHLDIEATPVKVYVEKRRRTLRANIAKAGKTTVKLIESRLSTIAGKAVAKDILMKFRRLADAQRTSWSYFPICWLLNWSQRIETLFFKRPDHGL